MCNCCNPNSPDNRIYLDSVMNEYYLNIETYEWDEYEDEFVHHREYINNCPWCGRFLKGVEDS